MKHRNFFNLDLHADGDRCLVQVGMDSLTPIERTWLMRLLQGVNEGRSIGFGVETTEADEQVIKFTLASTQVVEAIEVMQ